MMSTSVGVGHLFPTDFFVPSPPPPPPKISNSRVGNYCMFPTDLLPPSKLVLAFENKTSSLQVTINNNNTRVNSTFFVEEDEDHHKFNGAEAQVEHNSLFVLSYLLSNSVEDEAEDRDEASNTTG